MSIEVADQEKVRALGPPDLKLAGLQLWVHGYECPESSAAHDPTWLGITAHCGAPGASVWLERFSLRIPELALWVEHAKSLYDERVTEATLQPIEPGLRVALTATGVQGHIAMRVEITPDQEAQRHAFEFEIDQSYLSPLVEQCQRIIGRYRLHGARHRNGV